MSALSTRDLLALFEAALAPAAPPVLVSGLDMHAEQHQCWAARPEFGFLADRTDGAEYGRLSSAAPPTSGATASLKQALAGAGTAAAAQPVLLAAFRHKLGRVLGCSPDAIDADQPASALGLDSLSAVECRHWFYSGALLGRIH